jgi:hypothetical protein
MLVMGSIKDIAQNELSDDEIARRRDEAIRRALNTPPKPHKEMIGKGERAKTQRNSRVKKAVLSKPTSP